MKSGAIRVLILDGDPNNGKTLQQVLGREGYKVEVATSLKAGAKLADARRFHVMVVDLGLAGSEGIGAISKLRRKQRDVSVLLLNSAPSVESAVASLKGGIHDYLPKPVDERKLLGAIRELVNQRGLTRRPAEKLLSTVGSRLRSIRQEKNLTLRQVAESTGLSVSLLSQVERAESAASVASLHKIAAALNTSLHALFEDF